MRSLFLAIAIAAVMGPVLARTVGAQETSDFAAPPPPLDLGTITRTMFQSPWRNPADVHASGQEPAQEAAQAPPKSEPVPVPPAPPAQAVTAPQQPATVQLRPGQGLIVEEIVEQPAPAPLKRTYRITPAPLEQAALAPTPVAPIAPAQPAAAQTVAGVRKPANAIQRMVGNLGQKLVRVGYDRVLVPPAQPVVVTVQPTTYAVAPVPQPTPVAQPVEQPVTASPQSTRLKKGCFLRR